jgi:hypothetical protein
MRIRIMELIRRIFNYEESNENYELVFKIRGSKIELQKLQKSIVELVNV